MTAENSLTNYHNLANMLMGMSLTLMIVLIGIGFIVWAFSKDGKKAHWMTRVLMISCSLIWFSLAFGFLTTIQVVSFP